ncbi:glycosyltransferase [Halorubrum sp. SS5]|nr:glycosyltransferase [Halorubrum sp. SS5]
MRNHTVPDDDVEHAHRSVGRPFENPCVIHDPMTFQGGGERYAISLAECLDAPLYTSQCSIDIDSDITVNTFSESPVDRLLRRLPIWGLADALVYENFEVPEHHDVVITTGATSKAVLHSPHQHRYHVIHTPARWLFDRAPGRYRDSWGPIRVVKRFYQSYMRIHDLSTIPRIRSFVANSEVISQRMSVYYNREPDTVIYPPVNTEQFYHEANKGYILFIGRLEPHKGVEEMVRAVNNTNYSLKIAGTGSLKPRLSKLMSSNVELLGYVNCDALLFNSYAEDFGIVPIEAFASGKPVIGVREGYTKQQISDGENGVLFARGKDAMRDAIDRAYSIDWDPAEIQATSDKYSIEHFNEQWRKLIFGQSKDP